MSTKTDTPNATSAFFQWQRTVINYHSVRRLNVKDKRVVFNVLRNEAASDSTFIPLIGMTIGEFAVYQIVNEKN
uniref:Uncharacterized protein n=1 Tax=viral metagenome TaxID=1070528 RepID=A0A6C0KE94_9ZZZZ